MGKEPLGYHVEQPRIRQGDIVNIDDLPIVDTFNAYGFVVNARTLTDPQGATHTVGEVHFVPFGIDRTKKLAATAAGIEGLRKYFEHLDTEEANGNHITPETLIGVTNYYMAQAAESLGFSVKVIESDSRIERRRQAKLQPESRQYAVIGNVQDLRATYDQRAAKYVDIPEEENLLVRRSRQVSPDLWVRFDTNGKIPRTQQQQREIIERIRRELLPIEQKRSKSNVILNTFWGVILAASTGELGIDLLHAHNELKVAINTMFTLKSALLLGYNEHSYRQQQKFNRELNNYFGGVADRLEQQMHQEALVQRENPDHTRLEALVPDTTATNSNTSPN